MTKTIISNPYQSQNRQNLLKAGGLKNIDDTITPKNGERIYGKVGEVRFNQLAQNNGNDTGTITPPDCPDCPPIDPPTDPDNPTPDTPQGCTCRSLDELGDYIAQKSSESFCESTPVEDDNQYFPCLTGADGGELRISCPSDDDCEEVGNAAIYITGGKYLVSLPYLCSNKYKEAENAIMDYSHNNTGEIRFRFNDFKDGNNPLDNANNYFMYAFNFNNIVDNEKMTVAMLKNIIQKFNEKLYEIVNGEDFNNLYNTISSYCTENEVKICEVENSSEKKFYKRVFIQLSPNSVCYELRSITSWTFGWEYR